MAKQVANADLLTTLEAMWQTTEECHMKITLDDMVRAEMRVQIEQWVQTHASHVFMDVWSEAVSAQLSVASTPLDVDSAMTYAACILCEREPVMTFGASTCANMQSL